LEEKLLKIIAHISCADISCCRYQLNADISCMAISVVPISVVPISVVWRYQLYGDISCADISCADISCADNSWADISCCDISWADISCTRTYLRLQFATYWTELITILMWLGSYLALAKLQILIPSALENLNSIRLIITFLKVLEIKN